MTAQEANDYLVNYIKEKSGITLKPQEVRDFGLVEPLEETELDIKYMADDYLSELETENAEYHQQQKDFGLYDDTAALDMNLYY